MFRHKSHLSEERNSLRVRSAVVALAALLSSLPAMAARPNEACVGVLASAIARAEGYWTPGSIAQRFHNPGCLRGRHGAYLEFPTKESGWEALRVLIRSRLKRVGLTVMLDKWSETPGYPERVRRYAGPQIKFCD